MPYIVNFTDKENKTPITVFDNTSSTDTSLTFPGRNVTGYGQIIAENFLALLENFSSADEPINPIEGQLWYNSTDGVLLIWDNTSWKAASGIQKGVSEPSVAVSKVGELWVDTTNQQLRIFTGSRWILVGPTESSVGGLRYGPVIEKVADSDNVDRYVLTFYIADIPVIIFSKDSFTPKILISGFDVIRSGINIANPSTPVEVAQFSGGFEPTLFGPASTADGLTVGGLIIQSSKFLRSDTINTTDFAFNIRNNNGVTVGVDQTFNIGTTATAAKIYNSAAGSSIDIQLNRDGVPSTILRVVDNKVGINQAVPSQALDIDGSLTLTGSVIITNISASTNLNNGSFRTAGGAAVTKNLLVGDGVDITGVSQTNLIQPKNTDLHDLGTTTKRWRTIRAKTVIADTIEGVLSGNISGNANTATALSNVTSFQLTGDVASPAVQFDGQIGSYIKVFNTSLTANIIANKIETFTSKPNDYVLTYRSSDATLASSGLLKQTRDAFVGDMGIPIGGIIPYAGAIAPYGFLFCDGSEVERTKFQALYDVIGPIYNGASPLLGVLTFRLPDLRGRFALGKDNMDNAGTVPLALGGGVDGGGGTAGRVPDVKAITLGGDAGSSSATLIPANLPQHRHTLSSGNQDYKAVFVSTTIDPLATTGLGPTAPGQAQYLERTGDMLGVPTTSTPIGIMNPFLTINYIIRSGPPLF
jgi:microcystin-dependent protein